MAEQRSTRQRLIDEGVGLFAERGFRATGVGDIEAAAGLRPRRGALYKHFPSKLALLEEALRVRFDAARTGAAQLDGVDLASPSGADRALLRSTVVALGRWFLDEMDRLEEVTRILEHDGQRLPGIRREMKSDMVDLSYRATAALLAAAAPELEDSEAVAIVVLGSLVALRRTAWTFGSPPLDADDDRILRAWAGVILATLAAHGSAPPR